MLILTQCTAKITSLIICGMLMLCQSLVSAQSLHRIVLDPGHGGKDHGCTGITTTEKTLTLALSKRIKEELTLLMPHLQVDMTRHDDHFVALESRSSMANDLEADLFLSIHCNHHEVKSVNGLEAYVLGESIDEDNQLIANRENGGHFHKDELDDVPNILAEVKYHNNLSESITIASILNKTINNETALESRGVRQAYFRVLNHIDMPGVLLECGFISNKHDEAILKTAEGQSTIARAIARAIYTYYLSLDVSNVATANVNIETVEPLTVESTLHIPDCKYTVQIASTVNNRANLNRPEWSRIKQYDVYAQGNRYTYTYGKFDTLQSALRARLEVQNMGFAGAIVLPIDAIKGE